MPIIPEQNCICCYFGSGFRKVKSDHKGNVEVFFAKTKDLMSIYPHLMSLISGDEIMRAERFHINEDRETYIACHAILRSVISKKLDTRLGDVFFINDSYNKPSLVGNTLSFNISHTRDSFAFAVSDYSYIGIDLEKARQDFDFISIINTFFSKDEQRYIIESKQEAWIRFFLLWTRKEALLKAIGTGIIVDLTQIEVFQKDNFIDKQLFNNKCSYSKSNEIFIYSVEISDYYLSVAVPQKVDIVLNQLTEENLGSYFY